MGTGGNHSIHHIPGFFEVIPTMYIPKRNCARVITEKKAMTRFLLRVSAYKLLKE